MFNTVTRYGALARFFHWSIAVLILIDLALGLIGENTPRNAETAGMLQTLYSVHKTIGISVLMLAVLRVLWAIVQPKPVPVHPERKGETLLAETMHWALYGAIFVMPLSGWVMHSAETGFAPILWPFGQNLPFVPKSEDIAHLAGAVHGLSAWIVYITVGLHVLGALKHALIDRDGVLARMTKGAEAGEPAHHRFAGLPPLVAVVIWGAVLGTPFVLSGAEHPADTAVVETAVAAETQASTDLPVWVVEDGTLGITVAQMGAPVEGGFGAWTAAIAYDEDSGTGHVTVQIDIASLSLGTVTQQALGAEFFNVDSYSSASFEGEISRLDGGQHQAEGTLTLVGQTVPVVLAFDLTVEGDTATMRGTTHLDRRDFGIGAGYKDESTVGFTVDVTTELTAVKG